MLEYKIFWSFLSFCHFRVAWLCLAIQRLNHPIKFDIVSNTVMFQVTLDYVHNIVFNIITFNFLPFCLCQNSRVSILLFNSIHFSWLRFIEFILYLDYAMIYFLRFFCTEGMIGISNTYISFCLLGATVSSNDWNISSNVSNEKLGFDEFYSATPCYNFLAKVFKEAMKNCSYPDKIRLT